MSTISDNSEQQPASAFLGKRVAFAGKLGGVTKREAQQLVRQHGGHPVEAGHAKVDIIVVGADELPLAEPDELLGDTARRAANDGRPDIVTETQFWERLGLVEDDQQLRLYTPAMLADLLEVPVAIVRRWHRRRLIIPSREVHRLPYFDFQEVATARQLAKLLAAGASPAAIEKKLERLAKLLPEVDRPLAQLSVIVEGQQLLLREGHGLIEPGGQLRIDFDALEADKDHAVAVEPTVAASIPTVPREVSPDLATPQEMCEWAALSEDEGDLAAAAEMYRAAMAAGGPRPEICFELAEVLYRLGEVDAARERYYMAIELDEDYVEARANLGCVLAETGQLELAVAAFEGALHYHRDYPDVHYHLARTLDDLNQRDRAREHWLEFVMLAPDSPWSFEARQRLEQG